MSNSSNDTETYPGCGDSLSQLLRVAKRQLQDIALGKGVTRTIDQSDVYSLERDAFEVLRLVRFIKNSFAPINQIPLEILSLIPDYYREENTDQDLIALTQVCHGWRDMFISRASLWTKLDFKNADKTCTYIQRSQFFPLKIYLGRSKVINNVLHLVVLNIHRLKSLTIDTKALPGVLEHFRCPTPLLEELDIRSICDPVLDSGLFNGDLSSLRKLRLGVDITHFPWKNLANLQVIDLTSGTHKYGTTQILNLLESAPLLHTVLLCYSMPNSSDAPPDRTVRLRHLKLFTISTGLPHSSLLHHFHIPTGASLTWKFYFRGEELPLPYRLPVNSPNFSHLSHITAINLLFDREAKSTQLSGPSGSLRVLAVWNRWGGPLPHIKDDQILRSLSHPILLTIQRLTISKYGHPRPTKIEECPIIQTLSSTNDLKTLTLIDCNYSPFVLALDPEQNPTHLLLSPNMEEFILYNTSWHRFHPEHIISMAKNRASRGAKQLSIVFADLGGRRQMNKVFGLEEYVTRVEYRIERVRPAWDAVRLVRMSGFRR